MGEFFCVRCLCRRKKSGNERTMKRGFVCQYCIAKIAAAQKKEGVRERGPV